MMSTTAIVSPIVLLVLGDPGDGASASAAALRDALFVTLLVTLSSAVISLGIATSPNLANSRWVRLLACGALGLLAALFGTVLPATILESGAFAAASSGLVALSVLGAFTLLIRAGRTATGPPPVRWGVRVPWTSKTGRNRRALRRTLLQVGENPLSPALHAKAAEMHRQRGEMDRALYHAYAFAELAPSGPAQATALAGLVHLLVEAGDLQRARVVLRRLVRSYPNSASALDAVRLVSHGRVRR